MTVRHYGRDSKQKKRSSGRRSQHITMVAWLLCVGVLYFTDAIRPSVTPNKAAGRRPLRRLWYRRLDDGAEEVTKERRIPALDSLRHVDNTSNNNRNSRHAFSTDVTQELSTLLEDIESLAEELEAGKGIPTSVLKSSIRTLEDPTASSDSASSSDNSNDNEIKTVHELRQAILDEGKELRDIQLSEEAQILVNATASQLLHHDVVELMVERFKTGSTPGNRAPEDEARLALSIEGGGMRGAVSAGMASAIACLGLCDTFDAVYGSSAGSVIGSYMISRQMCMDVYVDILPAAKQKFVCTKRIVSALAVTAVDVFLSGVSSRRNRRRNNKQQQRINGNSDTLSEEELEVVADIPTKSRFAARASPGMNISFVLDHIMDANHGIRPLDMESFRRNDKKQPLRVASSYAKDGKLYCKCFGGEHFFHDEQPAVREDGKRQGLAACLEPSMTVPGATGPPVRLATHDSEEVLPYFDAFCFEPLPYRSAVEEGATHVLALCSRPEGFEPKTKPGVYEQAVAPLYFKSHGLPEVAEFFKRGGQQYIYLEDILTLEEGKVAGMNKLGPIAVPPAQILYGVEKDHVNHELSAQREEKWKKAHLLPLKVPLGSPELATLEQEHDAVREAVQGGFAAAFDLLAPAIGLNTHHELTGADVAALIFPKKPGSLDFILREQMRVSGDAITRLEPNKASPDKSTEETPSARRRLNRKRRDRFLRNARHVLRVLARNKRQQTNGATSLEEVVAPSAPELSLAGGDTQLADSLDDQQKAEHLLNLLPGIQSGRMSQLSANLHHVAAGPRSTNPSDNFLKP